MSEKHLCIRTFKVSVRIGEMRDIRALCWYPSVVLSPLYFAFHTIYNQPQRILPVWNDFQCDICMLAEVSGLDVN